MIGAVFYSGKRRLVIVEEYEGHGRDDPPGYAYKFDDSNTIHWISASGLSARFTKEPIND